MGRGSHPKGDNSDCITVAMMLLLSSHFAQYGRVLHGTHFSCHTPLSIRLFMLSHSIGVTVSVSEHNVSSFFYATMLGECETC